jgi:putative hydrolase of the HAD superfamily
LSDTETAFWTSTREWLNRLRPLKPIPTGYATNTRPLEGVGAVIFDIYGTLLISASGDVDVTEFTTAAVRDALSDLHLAPGAEYRIPDVFRETIAEHHSRSAHSYPEVDIVAVWGEIIEKLRSAGLARSGPKRAAKAGAKVENGPDSGDDADTKGIALAFELANNPVYPMPHAEAVLASLAQRGYPLGIVSNAQFFTPLVLAHFLDDWPFAEDLTVYSYRHMRAKPDPFLFQELEGGLRLRGLAPRDALYVGNDMLNDVATAKAAGLKTVLFAGDRRSLRLRQKRSDLKDVKPDRAIDDLSQLLDIVSQEPSAGSTT